MERSFALKNYNPYRFLVIFYIVGITGHLIPHTKNLMLLITPLALLISFITILIPFILNKQWKEIIFFLICGITGYAAEIIGVNSGMFFGNYVYGDILGPGVSGVPLIVGLNWIVILMGSVSLSEIFLKNKLSIILASAFLSVIFDYIMEPAAVFFKYWQWDANVIPVSNYITWGILTFILSAVFKFFNLSINNALPAFLFAVQSAYFFIIVILIRLKIIN